MTDSENQGTKDGQWSGTGNHDDPYVWGQPRAFLTTMQQAHLLVMRGYVLDVRAGAHGLAADGDLDITDVIVIERDSGVVVPVKFYEDEYGC